MTPAVLAEDMRKRYGDTHALAGFDLVVSEGSVCGLLGPNGAGKTTAVKALTTLLRFDSGRAVVAGIDVVERPAEVRYRIGVNGQDAALDEILTGWDNLVMFARLHHLTARAARERATELLEQFDLTDVARKPVRHYSGGMRRRLDLAASLVLAPRVLFLDEPTTGLDPHNRKEVWHMIRGLVAGGTTVLLTTQYLDEADQLADQIAVIDAGRVIANGTPDDLKSRLGGDQVDVVVRAGHDLAKAADLVARVTSAELDVDVDTRRITSPVRDRVAAMTEILRGLDDAGVEVADIGLRRPTLDEVFLRLTAKAVA